MCLRPVLQDCSMSNAPSPVDKALKLTIVGLIFLVFIAPVLTLMMSVTGMGVGLMMNSKLDFSSKRTSTNGILAGASEADLKALEGKLQDLTAYAGEAKSAAFVLQFIVVNFDDDEGQTAQNVFRPVALDLTSGEKTAVVVVPNLPTLWRVTTPEGEYRARFAVESATPFDLEDAPKGLLAGFHVSEFSGGAAALPRQYIEGREQRKFCEAIVSWIKFYGMRWRQARIVAVRNPKSIKVSPYGVVDDGTVIHGLPPLDSFCSR